MLTANEPKYDLIGGPGNTMLREGFWRRWKYVISALAVLALFWFTSPIYLSNDSIHRAPAAEIKTPVHNTTVEVEVPDRPLITYAYFETPNARINAEYFIRHGIHDGADFLFILNGETDIHTLLPDVPYVSYIKRENKCFDLGSHGAVLLSHKSELVKKYKRFILLNASIRGPFAPVWADACWSDKYLDRVTDKVKLVGMTFNCKRTDEAPPHVSSMIWATDRTGLEILLKTGLGTCFSSKKSAIGVEVLSAKHMHDAGYEVDVMMTAFHTDPEYQEHCHHDDVNWENAYFGMTLHPFDAMFVKANRKIDEHGLSMWSDWMDKTGYDSHQYCGSKKKPVVLRTIGEKLEIEKENKNSS